MLPQDEIDERLARYALTLDARDLWPDVTIAAFRAAQAEIARVTAAVLASAPAPVPLRLPPGTNARTLGIAASAAGIGPLLGFWCQIGSIATEPAVAQLLATHLDHGRRRAARLRQELERVLVPLAERHIDVFVLKGTYTAYRFFPEPGTRPTTDIDLLVRPEDGRAARYVLRSLGFAEASSTELQRSAWTPPNAGVVRSLELAHADNPWSLDLHLSLARGASAGSSRALGSPDPSTGELWYEFSRPVRVLPQPLLLAYLALHASSHLYAITLVRLVELILVARRDFAGHPERWQAFSDLVRATATGRFVFPALDLAERLAPGSVDPLVLKEVAAAAPPRLRRLVHGTTPGAAQRLHPYPLGERFLFAASPGEVLTLLAEAAWPRETGNLLSPRRALSVQWRRIRRRMLRIMPAKLRE